MGDGLIRLDPSGVVTYASPNALSAYRRLGLATDLVGTHLGSLTAELVPSTEPTDEAVSVVASGRVARAVFIESETAALRVRVKRRARRQRLKRQTIACLGCGGGLCWC